MENLIVINRGCYGLQISMKTPYSNIRKLIEIQKNISYKALGSLRPPGYAPRLVVGLDAAYSRIYGGVAVAVIIDYASGSLLDYSVAIGEPRLEYIPGLLAFREAPLFYTALQGLGREYDLLVIDGHGISHPRKAGIATHIGLALGKPSIGVAKKKLYGNKAFIKKPDECNTHPCTIGYVTDPETGEKLAYMVLPNKRSRAPIYISPGANIDLETALKIVTSMLKSTRLPLPTYHADKISKHIARLLDRGVLKPNQLKGGLGRLDHFMSRI